MNTDSVSDHKDETPLYNIGVVTRLTNISPATLRAWERRYNFPKARRSSGGHRLYSEKDILRLQWVKQRVKEGMQTSQAINSLRHQEEVSRGTAENARLVSETESVKTRSGYLAFQDRLSRAILSSDFQSADQLFSDALVFHTPEELILEVITPVLDKIGQFWAEKKISVADEHIATNYLRQRLLLWMLTSPPPMEIKPVILACAPEELHEGSLLIFATLLRRRRYPVLYLGQAVPLADLAMYVQEVRPSLVVLVAMTDAAARNLLDWKTYLPESALGGFPLVGFGGRALVMNSEFKANIGGLYLGDDIRTGLETIEKLFAK